MTTAETRGRATDRANGALVAAEEALAQARSAYVAAATAELTIAYPDVAQLRIVTAEDGSDYVDLDGVRTDVMELAPRTRSLVGQLFDAAGVNREVADMALRMAADCDLPAEVSASFDLVAIRSHR